MLDSSIRGQTKHDIKKRILEMQVKPHQKSKKCSEFPRCSLLQEDNNYTVDVDYGNPLNPNDTIVIHLDMNTCDYTVELVTSTHGNRLVVVSTSMT